MILIGDIGNTEVKIFLLTSKKKLKKNLFLKLKKYLNIILILN